MIDAERPDDMKSDNGPRKPIPIQFSDKTLDHFRACPSQRVSLHHSIPPSGPRKKLPDMQEQATLHAMFA
jgi:hypothetical protein